MAEWETYAAIVFVQAMFSGMALLSKAAFNGGMNTFVFVFYRQAIAALLFVPFAIATVRRTSPPPLPPKLLLKIFMLTLFGITVNLNVYSVGVKYTSATVASAITNSIPIFTFLLALLVGMETIKLKSLPGIAKIIGVTLCICGVLIIAFYEGPQLKPFNHSRPIFHKSRNNNHHNVHSNEAWIKGTFLMVSAAIIWAVWIVFQGVFVAGIALYLQAWCNKKKGPVFVAMFTPLTLIITIACSSFLLGEVINLGSVLGGALMVGGLYAVLWGKRKEIKKVQEKSLNVENGV